MSRAIALEVVGLRPGLDEARPRARLSGRGLLALKALALVALAAAALSGRLIPPALTVSTVAGRAGVELRSPAGWRPFWTAWGILVSETAARRRGPRGGDPCSAFIMRMPFDEFAELHRLTTRRSLGEGWHNDQASLLSAVAAHFGMDVPRCPAQVERLLIGGRPAAMMVSRCPGQWAAVAVAPADDLVIAGLCAPTARELQRVWRQGMAMLAAARLPEPVRSAAAASPNQD